MNSKPSTEDNDKEDICKDVDLDVAPKSEPDSGKSIFFNQKALIIELLDYLTKPKNRQSSFSGIPSFRSLY